MDQLLHDIEVIVTGRLHESTGDITSTAAARCRALLEEERKTVQYGIERHRPRFMARRRPRLFQVGYESRESFRLFFANFCVNRIWQPLRPYRRHLWKSNELQWELARQRRSRRLAKGQNDVATRHDGRDDVTDVTLNRLYLMPCDGLMLFRLRGPVEMDRMRTVRRHRRVRNASPDGDLPSEKGDVSSASKKRTSRSSRDTPGILQES